MSECDPCHMRQPICRTAQAEKVIRAVQATWRYSCEDAAEPLPSPYLGAGDLPRIGGRRGRGVQWAGVADALISGATSSTFRRRPCPGAARRGGATRACEDRYLRTVRRLSPFSCAISDRLIAPDSNSSRKRRSSIHCCGSKTTVSSPPPPRTGPRQTAQQQSSVRQEVGTFVGSVADLVMPPERVVEQIERCDR